MTPIFETVNQRPFLFFSISYTERRQRPRVRPNPQPPRVTAGLGERRHRAVDGNRVDQVIMGPAYDGFAIYSNNFIALLDLTIAPRRPILAAEGTVSARMRLILAWEAACAMQYQCPCHASEVEVGP